jgi:hypothetical protein
MRFAVGSVNESVPAHALGIHVGEILIFTVSTNASFADSVVDIATVVFQLIDGKALADVGTMQDLALSHAYLASSNLMMRTS